MKKSFNLKDDIFYATSVTNEQFLFSPFSESVESPRVRTYNHWTSGSVSGGWYQSLMDTGFDFVTPQNRLIDFTYGASVSSSFAQTGSNLREKKRIYEKYAQVLLGDPKKIFSFQGRAAHELIFVHFARNQFKDSIKPGNLTISTIFSGSPGTFATQYSRAGIVDSRTFQNLEETPGGPRAPLVINSTTQSDIPVVSSSVHVGAVYYQAGVAVLVPELVSHTASEPGNNWYSSASVTGAYEELASCINGFTYEDLLSGVRQRFFIITARSTSKQRNTFFKCVANNEEFNYSSNPSFTNTDGEIITTSGSTIFKPATYITKIGLLGPNDELLAVGVLSEPVRKDFDKKIEIKVRLDY